MSWVAAPAGWKLTRTQTKKARSGPDFVGLIVRRVPKGKDRCTRRHRPFLCKATPGVTIGAGGSSLTFEASMAAAGAFAAREYNALLEE